MDQYLNIFPGDEVLHESIGAHGASSGQNPLVQLDPGLFIWTILTFVLLLAILAKFAWKPLLLMLDERQKSIEDSLLSAKKARKELEGINEESEAILTKARNDAQTIVSDAKSAAEKLKEDIVSKAKLEADGQFETWLLANSNEFNVNISNPHVWVLQIQGPASTSVLKDASNNSLDESFGYYKSDFFDLGGQKIYVSRTGYTNELGYELYCPSDINHKALWDHLMKCGAPYGMEFSSTRAMTMRRIEGGIRENLVDMDTSVNPYDVGLSQFVNLDKENFIGKSSLINANKENKLFGVICKKSVPEVHAKITKSGKKIGKITSGVFSPTLKCGIGFLRVNSPLKIIGEEVQMIMSDDSIENCEVVDLPFFDQEKKIARGLDSTIPDVS